MRGPITHVVLKVRIAPCQEEFAAALVVPVLAGEVKRRESGEIPRVQRGTLCPEGLRQGGHGPAVSTPGCFVER